MNSLLMDLKYKKFFAIQFAKVSDPFKTRPRPDLGGPILESDRSRNL